MIERLPSTGLSRRAFMRGASLAGSGAAMTMLLSACGTSTDEVAEQVEAFELPTAEVPEGGGVVIAQRRVVVTQPTPGEYLAFSAVCTHEGCVLSGVEERGAFCGCHASIFDITTGEPVAGPAQLPLPSLPVTVSGDTLTVGA